MSLLGVPAGKLPIGRHSPSKAEKSESLCLTIGFYSSTYIRIMYNYVHMACGISFVKIEIDLHRWNNTVSVELLMSLGKFPWAPVDGPVASCHMTALRYFERGSMGGESNSFWFEGDWWNQLQTPADLDDYIRFWKKMRLLPAFKGKGRTGV